MKEDFWPSVDLLGICLGMICIRKKDKRACSFFSVNKVDHFLCMYDWFAQSWKTCFNCWKTVCFLKCYIFTTPKNESYLHIVCVLHTDMVVLTCFCDHCNLAVVKCKFLWVFLKQTFCFWVFWCMWRILSFASTVLSTGL